VQPEDIYLQAVINRHRPLSAPAPVPVVLHRFPYLESVSLSGSHAKGTALRSSDLDLFLSFSPSTPGPLSALLPSLAAHFRYCQPEIRNVSVKIHVDHQAIDLVPGRRREGSDFHTLWQSRRDTWLQTNIQEQIRHVRSSGLLNEIRALKIWTRRHALRFPSFAQELTVIRALTPEHPISESFLALLHFLSTGFPTARLIDPANSNNIVSDVLTEEEKHRIAETAAKSVRAETWPEIL
jgi:hypothetical protein